MEASMTNREIMDIALRQSAWDLQCRVEDFFKAEPVVVISKPEKRKKKFMPEINALEMVTYGTNVVASVIPELKEIAEAYLQGKDPERAFETPGILELMNALKPLGYEIAYMGQDYLPRVELLKEMPCPFETRVLEKGEFEHLYTDDFSNALCEKRKHLDILSVAAFDGGREIALAGCSTDGESMWQIGIDVCKEYRKMGVASALTSRLAMEVLKRGNVPFYGCAWANVKSQRNAVKCGFRPAWAFMTIKKTKTESGETT